MEMFTGVSLLRTAQSFLSGRTITCFNLSFVHMLITRIFLSVYLSSVLAFNQWLITVPVGANFEKQMGKKNILADSFISRPYILLWSELQT